MTGIISGEYSLGWDGRQVIITTHGYIQMVEVTFRGRITSFSNYGSLLRPKITSSKPQGNKCRTRIWQYYKREFKEKRP